MAFTPAKEFFSPERVKEREAFFARMKVGEVQKPSLVDALESLDCLPTAGGMVFLAGPPIRGRRRV